MTFLINTFFPVNLDIIRERYVYKNVSAPRCEGEQSFLLNIYLFKFHHFSSPIRSFPQRISPERIIFENRNLYFYFIAFRGENHSSARIIRRRESFVGENHSSARIIRRRESFVGGRESFVYENHSSAGIIRRRVRIIRRRVRIIRRRARIIRRRARIIRHEAKFRRFPDKVPWRYPSVNTRGSTQYLRTWKPFDAQIPYNYVAMETFFKNSRISYILYVYIFLL